jgi:hypothetical protein
MQMQKSPLYRKVNTRARGVHHHFGGDYRNERKSKAVGEFDSARESMHGKRQRGLDYTPLFKFLLSKVGKRWDDIFSEAVARLDRKGPIFWLVARSDIERRDFVCTGEATYFSGLYVDDDGLLQIVNPELGAEGMAPQCTCCTHTFNGIRFPVDPSQEQGNVV